MVDRAEELVILSAQGEDLVRACARITEEEEEDLVTAVSALPRLILWATDLRISRRK